MNNNNKNEAIKINYNKPQKYFILLNFKCFYNSQLSKEFLKVKDVVQFYRFSYLK